MGVCVWVDIDNRIAETIDCFRNEPARWEWRLRIEFEIQSIIVKKKTIDRLWFYSSAMLDER